MENHIFAIFVEAQIMQSCNESEISVAFSVEGGALLNIQSNVNIISLIKINDLMIEILAIK